MEVVLKELRLIGARFGIIKEVVGEKSPEIVEELPDLAGVPHTIIKQDGVVIDRIGDPEKKEESSGFGNLTPGVDDRRRSRRHFQRQRIINRRRSSG